MEVIKKNEYKTVSQFAVEKNVSTTTVYSWVKQGIVESMKIGKITLVKEKENKQ